MCRYASKITFWYGKIVSGKALLKYLNEYFGEKSDDVTLLVDEKWFNLKDAPFEIMRVPSDFIESETFIVGFRASSTIDINERVQHPQGFSMDEASRLKRKFKALKLPIKSFKPKYGEKYGASYYNLANCTCD